jgi:hypothetical protein
MVHDAVIGVQVRDSKLVADREARAARGRTAHLEQELSFYQTQSASAMVRAEDICLQTLTGQPG